MKDHRSWIEPREPQIVNRTKGERSSIVSWKVIDRRSRIVKNGNDRRSQVVDAFSLYRGSQIVRTFKDRRSQITLVNALRAWDRTSDCNPINLHMYEQINYHLNFTFRILIPQAELSIKHMMLLLLNEQSLKSPQNWN